MDTIKAGFLSGTLKYLDVTVTDSHVDTRTFCHKCHNLIDCDGYERRPGCGEPAYCEWC